MIKNATEQSTLHLEKPITENGIRINPFAWHTNDPPDLCGDFDPISAEYVDEISEQYDKANKPKKNKGISEDLLKCLEPYKLNDRLSTGEFHLEDADIPTDDRIIKHPDDMYIIEKQIYDIVDRNLMYSYVSQFDLPTCAFKTDKPLEEWLSEECIREVKRVARLIYYIYTEEYDYLQEHVTYHEYAIESYLPISHRDYVRKLFWDNKELMDDYQFFEAEPSQEEVENLIRMNSLLLEAAYYFIWNVKLIREKTPTSKEDLFKGFEVSCESFQEWRDCCADERHNSGMDAFIFCRDISSNTGVNSSSAQKEMAERYALEHGMHIKRCYECHQIFGRSGEQEAHNEMMADIRRIKPKYLIVKNQTCLSSSLYTNYHLLEVLSLLGVHVMCADGKGGHLV